jgi:hypothetical protein
VIAEMLVEALEERLNDADDPDLTNRILDHLNDHI